MPRRPSKRGSSWTWSSTWTAAAAGSLLVVALASGCASVPPPATAFPREAPVGDSEVGVASFYTDADGSVTANGERFDDRKMTAAHRTLPFGTWVRVENLANGVSVLVRINDRGPYVEGRIIDLSKAAARHLGMLVMGIARVRVTVVRRPARRR